MLVLDVMAANKRAWHMVGFLVLFLSLSYASNNDVVTCEIFNIDNNNSSTQVGDDASVRCTPQVCIADNKLSHNLGRIVSAC